MEEPALRAYVQTLTKRLMPEFESIPDEEKRIELAMRQPESGEPLMNILTGMTTTTTKTEVTARPTFLTKCVFQVVVFVSIMHEEKAIFL